MPLTDYVISAGQHSENVPPTDDNMEHELQEEFEPEATYVVDILASTEAGQSSKVTKTITTNKYCKFDPSPLPPFPFPCPPALLSVGSRTRHKSSSRSLNVELWEWRGFGNLPTNKAPK